MVNTNKLVIGYILTFLGIYLLTINISMIINIRSDSTIDLIGTSQATTALSTIGSPSTVYAGFGLFFVGIIILIIFGLINTFGAF